MSYDLRQILGVMASFCEITGVDAVHVLQCDTEVTADEWVPAAELSNFNIFGFGGSDMSPAMYQLAADPEVEACYCHHRRRNRIPRSPHAL
ncbi:MAG: hypothetical protein IPN33_07390 [Saprospiraceae bacterium]|nr:hypothetical protein [Saprospiraceae bacterium]